MKNQLEQEMATGINDYRASGKTLAAYCAENDLPIDKMKY